LSKFSWYEPWLKLKGGSGGDESTESESGTTSSITNPAEGEAQSADAAEDPTATNATAETQEITTEDLKNDLADQPASQDSVANSQDLQTANTERVVVSGSSIPAEAGGMMELMRAVDITEQQQREKESESKLENANNLSAFAMTQPLEATDSGDGNKPKPSAELENTDAASQAVQSILPIESVATTEARGIKSQVETKKDLKEEDFLSLLDANDPLSTLASAAVSTALSAQNELSSSLPAVIKIEEGALASVSQPGNADLNSAVGSKLQSVSSMGETGEREKADEKDSVSPFKDKWVDVVYTKYSCFQVRQYFNVSEKLCDYKPDHDGSKDMEFIKKRMELQPGTTYKFRVAAINSCGRGPWSEVRYLRST